MGRGSSKAGKSGGGGKSAPSKPKTYSSKEINGFGRAMAVSVAKAAFIFSNVLKGLSEADASRRFDALVSGNTTAQLKSYIKNRQKEWGNIK